MSLFSPTIVGRFMVIFALNSFVPSHQKFFFKNVKALGAKIYSNRIDVQKSERSTQGDSVGSTFVQQKERSKWRRRFTHYDLQEKIPSFIVSMYDNITLNVIFRCHTSLSYSYAFTQIYLSYFHSFDSTHISMICEQIVYFYNSSSCNDKSHVFIRKYTYKKIKHFIHLI